MVFIVAMSVNGLDQKLALASSAQRIASWQWHEDACRHDSGLCAGSRRRKGSLRK